MTQTPEPIKCPSCGGVDLVTARGTFKIHAISSTITCPASRRPVISRERLTYGTLRGHIDKAMQELEHAKYIANALGDVKLAAQLQDSYDGLNRLV